MGRGRWSKNLESLGSKYLEMIDSDAGYFHAQGLVFITNNGSHVLICITSRIWKEPQHMRDVKITWTANIQHYTSLFSLLGYWYGNCGCEVSYIHNVSPFKSVKDFSVIIPHNQYNRWQDWDLFKCNFVIVLGTLTYRSP